MTLALCGKRDFTGVIKLRLLRWGDNPGLVEWALHIMFLYRLEEGREGLNYRRVVDVRKEARGQSEAKKGPRN